MVEVPEKMSTDPDDAVWELIPWYVNGTLGVQEAQMVERKRDSDPEFAAELEHQLAVAAGVRMLTEPEVEQAEARSWDSLRARIEAEEGARSPAQQRSWWAGWLPDLQGGYAMAGLACVALLLGVVFLGQTGPGSDQGFQTLTSDPQSGGMVIKIQPAADLDRAVLERLLSENGLKLIGDPSSAGVYRAEIAEGADPQAVADILMGTPEILFAAPE